MVISINSFSSYINTTYKNGYSGRVEINIKNNFAGQGKIIKSCDLQNLKLSYPSGVISYMNEQDTQIQTKNAVYQIKAVLSGENLADFSGLEILRGKFFNNDQFKYGNRVAVISDTLAQKLFMTHHVIGNIIYISGIKYKIIGLYKSKTALLSELSSDGSERVYIPFYSLSKSSAEKVTTIYIKDESLESMPFKEKMVAQTLKERLKADAELYQINDYYKVNTYATQPLALFIFLVGIFCIFYIIKYFLEFIKSGFLYMKNCLQDEYFAEVLKKNVLRILLFIVLVTAFIIAVITLFSSVSFKASVPYKYIPSDNVFDFSFYAEQIKDSVQSMNNSAGYISTQLELLSRYSLLFIYISMLLLIINFISVLSVTRVNRLLDLPLNRLLLYLAASVLLGAAFSLAFCTACGIGYNLPVKGIIILILFNLLRLINANNVKIKTSLQIISNLI
jgi:hypothetical protein